jgi:hypothetical protein
VQNIIGTVDDTLFVLFFSVTSLAVIKKHLHLHESSSTFNAHAQMLKGLQVNAAVEVLRAAPGTFLRNFTHLPQFLKPIAALAEYPALGAVCTVPVDTSFTRDTSSTPSVAFVLDTSSDDRDFDQIHTCDTESDVSTTDRISTDQNDAMQHEEASADFLWLCEVERTAEAPDSGMFALETRPGTVLSHLSVKDTVLQNTCLELPDNACIAFNQACMRVCNVTFHGACLVETFVQFSCALLWVEAARQYPPVSCPVVCISLPFFRSSAG